MQERVLILIPTHNRVHYLKLAVASVLAQAYANFRLIISDNSTNDEAAAYVAKEVHDPRVEYVRFGDGVPAGEHGDFIENLIEKSPESIVTIMHDDDQMTPEHIAEGVALLRNSHLGLVASPPCFIDEDGVPLKIQRKMTEQSFYKGRWGGLRAMRRNKFVFSSVIYRKPAFFRSTEFRHECLGFADFASNLINVFQFGCVLKSNPTLLYRVHGGQDINNYDKDPKLTLRLLDVARHSAIRSYGKSTLLLNTAANFFKLTDLCVFFVKGLLRKKVAKG